MSGDQVNIPSTDYNPSNFWRTRQILQDGSPPYANAFGSSAHLTAACSNVADSNFGVLPAGYIDHNRPRQTNGSVLASTALRTELGLFYNEAATANPQMASMHVSDVVRGQPDVVDLTEDSDGEEDNNDSLDHTNQIGERGKRKMEDYLESDKKKICGQISEKYGTGNYNFQPQNLGSTHGLGCQEEMPQHLGPMDMGFKMQSWNGISNGTSYIDSTRESSTFHIKQRTPLGAGGMASSRKDHMPSHSQSLTDKRPTIAKKGRVPPEEVTPADGLMTVPLLKHQRIALAWMEKREVKPNVQGGILADDQGLGKTVCVISLILKAPPPTQNSSVKVLDSSEGGALTVDLGDDDEEVKNADVSQNDAVVAKESHDGNLLRRLSTSETASDSKETREELKSSSSKCRPAAGTLVVCPTSVLRQWEHELKEKVSKEAGLSVLVYHGSNRTRDSEDLTKYDVVLSTYSIVSMEVPKQPLPEDKDNDRRNSGCEDFPPLHGGFKSKKTKKLPENVNKVKANGRKKLKEGENGSADSGPLARVTWFRVVLDEAQSIKNSRTQVARATWGLRAKRRWCLSGTPIQNSIEDLFSYFRFLRYFPYDTYKIFQERIKDQVTRNPDFGYKLLQKLLFEPDSGIMMRRTKSTKIDGRPIVDLPPRIVTLKQAEFSDEERSFYSVLENESRKQFQDFAAAGTLQSNYVNILWMLLRLRQACNHPLLVKGYPAQVAQTPVADSAKSLPADEQKRLLAVLEANRSICTICNDLPDEAVVCICAHVFCRQCISDQLSTGDDTCCPFPKCRKSLNLSLVFDWSSLKSCELDEGCGSNWSLQFTQLDERNSSKMEWKSSSKIDAVIKTLKCLPEVSLIVEDGKVVVQASKDLEVRLLDTSSVKFEREPLSLASSTHSDLLERFKSIPVLNCDSGSEFTVKPVTSQATHRIQENPSSNLGKVEMSNSTFSRMKLPMPEIGAGSLSGVDEGAQFEPVSTDRVRIREPLSRQFIKSTEKAIVFSQWTSMLDLLEVKLKEAKFNYRRLDGTMSVVARDRAISEFKSLPEVTVIIMSLKAASLGLNMVAACHVLLIDVWWNPTMEDQAIDRAHRIGQTRTVNVSRFTVKNTIEDRILLLQERKREMCAQAFGESYTGGQQSKLTGDDLRFLFKA